MYIYITETYVLEKCLAVGYAVCIYSKAHQIYICLAAGYAVNIYIYIYQYARLWGPPPVIVSKIHENPTGSNKSMDLFRLLDLFDFLDFLKPENSKNSKNSNKSTKSNNFKN